MSGEIMEGFSGVWDVEPDSKGWGHCLFCMALGPLYIHEKKKRGSRLSRWPSRWPSQWPSQWPN